MRKFNCALALCLILLLLPFPAARAEGESAPVEISDAAGMLARVDAMATELERLDKAARACRGD